MIKVLIFGGSGLLGQYLNIAADKKFEILTTYNNNPGNCTDFQSRKIDIRNYEELRQVFKDFKPGIVINLAAVTAHSECNKLGMAETLKINTESAKIIGLLSEEINAKLIYTSTDLVYKDDTGELIKEDGELEPKSIYAETKLLAEEEIGTVSGNYLILRTSLMYGFGLNGKQNFFSYMYEQLKEGRKLKLFSDQFRTTMSLRYAADAIADLCDKEVKDNVINFGGRERLSRYETGRILAGVMGIDETLVEKGYIYDNYSPDFAADVSMNTDKLQSLGIVIPYYWDAVKEELTFTNNGL